MTRRFTQTEFPADELAVRILADQIYSRTEIHKFTGLKSDMACRLKLTFLYFVNNFCYVFVVNNFCYVFIVNDLLRIYHKRFLSVYCKLFVCLYCKQFLDISKSQLHE